MIIVMIRCTSPVRALATMNNTLYHSKSVVSQNTCSHRALFRKLRVSIIQSKDRVGPGRKNERTSSLV